jgi:hypothetical protein
VYPYAVITAKGDLKLLLINKRDRDFEIPLGAAARNVEFVDQSFWRNSFSRQHAGHPS